MSIREHARRPHLATHAAARRMGVQLLVPGRSVRGAPLPARLDAGPESPPGRSKTTFSFLDLFAQPVGVVIPAIARGEVCARSMAARQRPLAESVILIRTEVCWREAPAAQPPIPGLKMKSGFQGPGILESRFRKIVFKRRKNAFYVARSGPTWDRSRKFI